MFNKSFYVTFTFLSLAFFALCKACEPSGMLYIIVLFSYRQYLFYVFYKKLIYYYDSLHISNLIWIYGIFFSTPGDLRWFSIKKVCSPLLPDFITVGIQETYENSDLALYGIDVAVISQLLPIDDTPNDFRVCAWWKVPEKGYKKLLNFESMFVYLLLVILSSMNFSYISEENGSRHESNHSWMPICCS